MSAVAIKCLKYHSLKQGTTAVIKPLHWWWFVRCVKDDLHSWVTCSSISELTLEPNHTVASSLAARRRSHSCRTYRATCAVIWPINRFAAIPATSVSLTRQHYGITSQSTLRRNISRQRSARFVVSRTRRRRTLPDTCWNIRALLLAVQVWAPLLSPPCLSSVCFQASLLSVSPPLRFTKRRLDPVIQTHLALHFSSRAVNWLLFMQISSEGNTHPLCLMAIWIETTFAESCDVISGDWYVVTSMCVCFKCTHLKWGCGSWQLS